MADILKIPIVGHWHEMIYRDGIPQIEEHTKQFDGLIEFGNFMRGNDHTKTIEYLKLEQYLDPHYLGIIL